LCDRYDYEAQSTTDLSFRRGDLIAVEGQFDSSWWKGTFGDEVGLFPGNYVRGLENIIVEGSEIESECSQVCILFTWLVKTKMQL